MFIRDNGAGQPRMGEKGSVDLQVGLDCALHDTLLIGGNNGNSLLGTNKQVECWPS